jgi:hypothetical protein
VKSVKKPRPLQQLFRESRHLRGLLEQVDDHSRLLAQVHQALPAPLRAHCHAAHIEAAQLVLFTDSPAWVMRLRFSSTAILTAMRSTRPNLKGIRVRVQLPGRALKRPARRAELSEQARQHLRDTAAALEPGPLRDALERLGRSR